MENVLDVRIICKLCGANSSYRWGIWHLLTHHCCNEHRVRARFLDFFEHPAEPVTP